MTYLKYETLTALNVSSFGSIGVVCGEDVVSKVVVTEEVVVEVAMVTVDVVVLVLEENS